MIKKRIRPTVSKLMSAQPIEEIEETAGSFTPKECAEAFTKNMDIKQRQAFRRMTKHCRVGEDIAKVYKVPYDEFMEELLKII